MPKRNILVLVSIPLLVAIIFLSVMDVEAIGTSRVAFDNTPPIPTRTAPAVTGTPIPLTGRQEAPSISFSTGILDDFNRPNGPLGSNWSGATANYAITSTRLLVSPGNDEDIYWNASPFGVGQVVSVTLSTIDAAAEEIGLILKAQNITDAPPALIDVFYNPAGGYVQVWTYSETQSWNQRGTNIPVSYSNGDVFGAHARANGQVEVYKNGQLIDSRDVTDWPFYAYDGYIGLFNINAGTTILDDFGGGTTDNAPTPTPPPPPCTNPLTCNPVSSISTRWRCNTLDCPPNTADWTGAVIAWPWYTAFESNNRVNLNSRTVYPFAGNSDAPLFAYMKDWADGCQITAVSGTVVIIEWERGSEAWTATTLLPGQTYTVTLSSPENGVLIEGPDEVLDEFRVSLSNCTPPSSPRSFGETSNMNSTSAGHGDRLYAQQTSLGGSGDLQSISIYIDNQNPSGQLRLGIYNDNGGSPGTLLGETAPFAPVHGWNTQNVLTQTALVAGTYWLAFVPETNSMRFAMVNGTGVNWHTSHTFANLPGSFPVSPISQTVKFSIYATMIQGPTAVSLESLYAQQYRSPLFLLLAMGLLGISITTITVIVGRKYRRLV
ncbi:MAG TPA: hypothetical protein PLK31_06140 [Chloroflexota bacterium]|nr:hypothetical protein [Chloroflexota bacterium]